MDVCRNPGLIKNSIRSDVREELLHPYTMRSRRNVTIVTWSNNISSLFAAAVGRSEPLLIRNGAQHVLFSEQWTADSILADPMSRNERYTVSYNMTALSKNKNMSVTELIDDDSGVPITLTGRWSADERMRHNKPIPVLQQTYMNLVKWDKNPLLQSRKGDFAMKITRRGGSLPHSHCDTLNVLTVGSKRWIIVIMQDYSDLRDKILYESIAIKNAALRHAVHENAYTSLHWISNQSRDPSFIPHTHYDFVQRAGDVLFVPESATHTTLDICDLQIGAVLQGRCIAHTSGRSCRPPCFAPSILVSS